MKKHIKKHIKSQQFAFTGLATAFKSEPNFKLELIISAILIFLGIYLHFELIEWFLLIHAISQVLITELLNTGLEYLADGFTKEFNPHIKKAKDITAGAVLLSAIYAIFIAILILIYHMPKLGFCS